MPEQHDNGEQERRRLVRTGVSLRTIASVVVLLVALPIVALLWWSAEKLQVVRARTRLRMLRRWPKAWPGGMPSWWPRCARC